MAKDAWPDIAYPDWADTCSALHLQCQIVGKYRLARTPWINHSWHATLYVDAAGLTTGLVPDGDQGTAVVFDLHAHRLVVTSSMRGISGFDLEPMSICEFLSRFRQALRSVGANDEFDGSPNELPDATPFADDRRPRPWDPERVARFHDALVSVRKVFTRFRSGFLGKVSPVHLFWGSFDLAVTRFSGRAAPLHPGGIPHLPDAVTREAYSHEVSSAGFWPGGGGAIDYPAFYSYAYPAPPGFSRADVEPQAAFFSEGLGEFILPYQAVRDADDPERELLRFLHSTYQAAANLAEWDRPTLECPEGEPRLPRPVPAG